MANQNRTERGHVARLRFPQNDSWSPAKALPSVPPTGKEATGHDFRLLCVLGRTRKTGLPPPTRYTRAKVRSSDLKAFWMPIALMMVAMVCVGTVMLSLLRVVVIPAVIIVAVAASRTVHHRHHLRPASLQVAGEK